MSRRRVVVDTDPALGIPRRDVDDGLALLMLLAAPAVHFEGVTVTFGNVGTRVGVAQAKKLLALVGASTPVFEGAHSRQDRGQPSAAAEYLVEAARAHPGEISLVAIGFENLERETGIEPATLSLGRESETEEDQPPTTQ